MIVTVPAIHRPPLAASLNRTQRRRAVSRCNASAEPVLATWGIDTDGKPVCVGLDAASSESAHVWEGFLSGLGERGLLISDGAAGLIGAVERTMGAPNRRSAGVQTGRDMTEQARRAPPTD